MGADWYTPDTFFGYISKIDPCDAEIKKVENAGFFRLEVMIPEIHSRIEGNERELDSTAVAILGFHVSGDFEKMASMKADLIQFMQSSDLKKYFNPEPKVFSGFYWEVEQDEDCEESEYDEESDYEEEELESEDEEDVETTDEDSDEDN
jgi:hypothetical protein